MRRRAHSCTDTDGTNENGTMASYATFPGPINDLRGGSADPAIQDQRCRLANSEQPATAPHRLVLYPDASKRPREVTQLVNGVSRRVWRVGITIAVAWQQWDENIGDWTWREKTWDISNLLQGKQRTAERAELIAMQYAISKIATPLWKGEDSVRRDDSGCRMPVRYAAREVAVYTDCDTALRYIRDPVAFSHVQGFRRAELARLLLNRDAQRLSDDGVSVVLTWIPGKGDTAVPGNTWADCMAKRANDYDMVEEVWKEMDMGRPMKGRRWHYVWWWNEMYSQGRTMDSF